MSESHGPNEPHNGACAFGADCGHATIIDNAALATLQAGNAELRRQLDLDQRAYRAEAAALRERLEAAERATYHERNRADIIARENRKPACYLCKAALTWDSGMNDPWERADEVAVRCWDCGSVMCKQCCPTHYSAHEKELRARAAAAEGERDRLRGLLATWPCRACDGSKVKAVRVPGRYDYEKLPCKACEGTGIHGKARAALAAIPHTEGEAKDG